MRLSNLCLGYTLPVEYSRKAWMKKARIYVKGYNFLTITKYEGWEPEAMPTNFSTVNNLNAGVVGFDLPHPRAILAGVEVNF